MSIRHWMVLISACLLMLGSSAGTCFSFFVEPITSELGYSRATFTLCLSLVTSVGALTMPMLGIYFSKFGARKIIIMSGIVSTLGIIAFSFSTSLMSFYLSGILVGVLYNAATLLGSVFLVNTWFEAKKGLIMGITMAFSGVGGALGGFILPNFISQHGWRSGYLLLSFIFFLVTVIVPFLLVRNTPQSVGLLAYGVTKDKNCVNNKKNRFNNKEIHGVSFSRALKTKQFYMMYIGFVLVVSVVSFCMHIPAYFTGQGLTNVESGSLMSILMIVLVFAKIICGFLNDKFGPIITMLICFGLYFSSFIVLLMVSSYIAFVICMGNMAFGTATITVLFPLMINQVFGQKEYSKIYGILGTSSVVGFTLGTPLWGYIYDITGSYNIGFYGACVLLILATLLLVSVIKHQIKPKEEKNHKEYGVI